MKFLMICIVITVTVIQSHTVLAEDRKQYLARLTKLQQTDNQQEIGASLQLSDNEVKVDRILMGLKLKETEYGNLTNTFPPANHFFKAKARIQRSDVFKIIRKLPKGGALHLHDTALVNLDWMVANLTYREDCYMCYKNDTIEFHYFTHKPTDFTQCKWQPVNLLRNLSGNPHKFDKMIHDKLSFVVDDPDTQYPNQDIAWNVFQEKFIPLNSLVFYAPVFRDYYKMALQEFLDDNVQYLETRIYVQNVLSEDGSMKSKEWLIKEMIDVTKRFIEENPQFIGSNTIYETSRFQSNSDVLSELKDAISLRRKYPSHVIGFDLVAREDTGLTLRDYLDVLLYPSQQTPPADMPYYFHAGETDWSGSHVDNNILDAVLLNSSRIGHGYGITKHPAAMSRKIPIEVNPISNQVLGLVKDLRNHPAASLLKLGYPIVISSDDPSLVGASALSYDWYETFMGLGGMWADLRFLKQLAINSIQFSALDESNKDVAFKKWSKRWNDFIDEMIEIYHL